jgi:hypothetical protein
MIHTPNQSVNALMRLQAPDYSPDSPAAVFTFPSSTYSSSINSNLLLAQRRGLLFNSYVGDGTTATTTLQRLDPASLKPVWTRAGLQGALSVVEPAEEVVAVAQYSGDQAPWTTQLDTYAVADGSPKSRWLAQWKTPEKVTLRYAGAALNRSSGEQRLCARLATGWSSQLAHAEWLTCVDPLTSRVTLTVTLKAAGEPSARADLLVRALLDNVLMCWLIITFNSLHMYVTRRCTTRGRWSRTRPPALCWPSTALAAKPTMARSRRRRGRSPASSNWRRWCRARTA